jgi:mRNA interferase HigB
MIVFGADIVEAYFVAHKGHKGIEVARSQYGAWLKLVKTSTPKTPEDIKKMHPKASILKASRVVFNIKENNFRLVVLVQYVAGVMQIRFFDSHEEYDKIDAEKV